MVVSIHEVDEQQWNEEDDDTGPDTHLLSEKLGTFGCSFMLANRDHDKYELAPALSHEIAHNSIIRWLQRDQRRSLWTQRRLGKLTTVPEQRIPHHSSDCV